MNDLKEVINAKAKPYTIKLTQEERRIDKAGRIEFVINGLQLVEKKLIFLLVNTIEFCLQRVKSPDVD